MKQPAEKELDTLVSLPHKESCLVHELRQLVQSDERVTALREAGEIDELQSYLQTEYEELYALQYSARRTRLYGTKR